MAEPVPKVPTLNDLRVKLCYICREEELHDKPEDPPRVWTHPCNCTLIAHESCLLQWIQSSQADNARAPNALKCPQCGSNYELESERGVVLRLLDIGNRSLSLAGSIFTIASVTAVVVSFGAGIYTVSTAYGAYALQEFLGKEMFDLLLTDDPSAWPWHAFFNLPFIPLSLVLSRTPLPTTVMPLIPILLAWPTSTPVASRERSIIEQWRPPPQSASGFALHSLSNWPPSPAFIGLLVFPLARSYYRFYFSKFKHWVLETQPTGRSPVRRFMFAFNAPFQIRLGANIEEVRAEPRQEGRQANVDANAPQQPQLNANPDGNVNPEAVALAAADVIHVTGFSLGRLVGGALMLPKISSVMGSFLFRLSAHSTLLRRFLAVRPSMRELPPALGPWSYPENWSQLSPMRQIGVAAQLVLSVAWRGTRTWAECDPVWWRNSIGLGIFVVAKDCIHLLHLWYAKRELESRKVKNRSFEGVDIKELDLIDPVGAV